MMNLPSLATSSTELLQLTDSSWIVVQYHIIQNNLADVAILAQAIRLWGFFANPPTHPHANVAVERVMCTGSIRPRGVQLCIL